MDDHLEVENVAIVVLEGRDEQTAIGQLTRLDAGNVDLRGLFAHISTVRLVLTERVLDLETNRELEMVVAARVVSCLHLAQLCTHKSLFG